MYIVVEENPNCGSEERMFATAGTPRPIERIQLESPAGATLWCEATTVDEKGHFCPAQAVLVEDSSAGTAWLIFGGSWGVRFKPKDVEEAWSLQSPQQWGAPFLVLDASTPLTFSTASSHKGHIPPGAGA